MVQPTEKPTLKPTMKPKLKLKKVGGARQTKHGKGEGGKKGTNKSITIPSIEYPVSWSSMLQHGGCYSVAGGCYSREGLPQQGALSHELATYGFAMESL